MTKRRRGRKNTNRLGIISITLVVALLSVVLTIQTFQLRDKNKELIEKKQKLQEALEIQNDRKVELEEQRVYIQTNKYIEEKAKDLGYIYPNEIIYKPIQ